MLRARSSRLRSWKREAHSSKSLRVASYVCCLETNSIAPVIPVVLAGQFIERFSKPPYAFFRCCNVQMAEREAQRRSALPRGIERLGRHDEDKIGRASCRERV